MPCLTMNQSLRYNVSKVSNGRGLQSFDVKAFTTFELNSGVNVLQFSCALQENIAPGGRC